MSKIFYDHLIIMRDLEIVLSEYNLEPQEKIEIHQLIEESVQHRIVSRILDHLPRKEHKKFLSHFYKRPYDENILDFLKEKIFNIENLIRNEVSLLEKEILASIKSKPSTKRH